MTVRALLAFLRNWIDERLDDIANGRIANPERTIASYWLKNAGDGTHFSKKTWCLSAFTTSSRSANGATRSLASCRASVRIGGDPPSAPRSRRRCRAIRTPRTARLIRHLRCSSWSCFARSRRTVGASPRFRIRGRQARAATASRPSYASVSPTSAAATSSRRTKGARGQPDARGYCPGATLEADWTLVPRDPARPTRRQQAVLTQPTQSLSATCISIAAAHNRRSLPEDQPTDEYGQRSVTRRAFHHSRAVGYTVWCHRRRRHLLPLSAQPAPARPY
jgi:hypothetical protein